MSVCLELAQERVGLGDRLSDSLKAAASRRQFGRVLRARTWHETERWDLGAVPCRLWAIDPVPLLSARLGVLPSEASLLLPTSKSCVSQRCARKGSRA